MKMTGHQIRRQMTATERSGLGGLSDVVSHLLFHRGVTEDVSAAKFLVPDYERDTHDPFLFKDAEKAAERIIMAIRDGEKIAIYADYDADGIPGAVIWNDFFKRIGFVDFIIYIPHRHNEGFGLNENAIDKIVAQGVKLLVTVDCGIADVGPVARAREMGMDVIITDHHEPPLILPLAYAIVDHKQDGCAYPDKNLCGSGVAFKVIQAVLKKVKKGERRKEGGGLQNFRDGHEKWLLDMVGIATLSDMVPLTGENRVFAMYGLQVLRKSPRKGLMRLLAKLKIAQKHLTEDDIAFMITPRINAASRMGVPMDAFHLLAADDDTLADEYADRLESVNNERKGVVASLVKEIKKTIVERHGAAVPSVIVLGNPDWRPSLLGLAANSCAEEYDRPVFLWGRDGDGCIKGSCRSEGRTHVVELMRAVSQGVLTQFGGHKHSGGFVVASDAVHYLEQRLNEAADLINGTVSDIGLAGTEASGWIHEDLIDLELSLDAVDYRLYDDIAKLAPFGTGNPKPIFLFRNVRPESVRQFGKANDHVELIFKNSRGGKIPAISFFGVSNEWAKSVQPNVPVDLVASLEKSMFRGRAELRLRVIDVILV